MTTLRAMALGFMVVLGAAVAHAGDGDVAAIKRHLDQAREAAAGRSSGTTYGTVGLLVLDTRDSRTFAAPARRKIVSVAVRSGTVCD